jgi:hypothetical protein
MGQGESCEEGCITHFLEQCSVPVAVSAGCPDLALVETSDLANSRSVGRAKTGLWGWIRWKCSAYAQARAPQADSACAPASNSEKKIKP